MTETIQNVPDTAFVVAAIHEAETNRPDALFHDPLAAKLSGARERLDVIVRLVPKG